MAIEAANRKWIWIGAVALILIIGIVWAVNANAQSTDDGSGGDSTANDPADAAAQDAQDILDEASDASEPPSVRECRKTCRRICKKYKGKKRRQCKRSCKSDCSKGLDVSTLYRTSNSISDADVVSIYEITNKYNNY